MADKKLTWSPPALKQLDRAIEYIAYDSPQNADRVRRDILHKAQNLLVYPEINQLDKYKVNNDGTYRYFEMHRLRVAYRITEKQIIIFRLRHTSREPREY